MNKCKKCGRCCYLKTYYQGIPVFTNIPCPHLDTDTNLCTVYEKRFEMGVGCLNRQEAIKEKALPNDCPYVEKIKKYKGPVTVKEALDIIKNAKA